MELYSIERQSIVRQMPAEALLCPAADPFAAEEDPSYYPAPRGVHNVRAEMVKSRRWPIRYGGRLLHLPRR